MWGHFMHVHQMGVDLCAATGLYEGGEGGLHARQRHMWSGTSRRQWGPSWNRRRIQEVQLYTCAEVIRRVILGFNVGCATPGRWQRRWHGCHTAHCGVSAKRHAAVQRTPAHRTWPRLTALAFIRHTARGTYGCVPAVYINACSSAEERSELLTRTQSSQRPHLPFAPLFAKQQDLAVMKRSRSRSEVATRSPDVKVSPGTASRWRIPLQSNYGSLCMLC